VVERGWVYVSDFARVDSVVWGWVVKVGEDGLEVRSESHWELFRWDSLLPSVYVSRGVKGVGVELRCERLEVYVLVGEPGGLGVFVYVLLAESENFVRVKFDEVFVPEESVCAWWGFSCGGGGVVWVVGECGLV
jgi:hypothetical protein